MEKKQAEVSANVGNCELTLETGKLAKQAGGSVFARYGDAAVLAAVCRADARPDIDFFPLTVEYRENKFAAGKIPGGFFKREGRPRRKETLTCRLIDRPIRPMFPEGFCEEVQVSVLVYSADQERDPDVIGLNAASAALMLSDIPFYGPIGAVRIGRVDGRLIVNPLESERVDSDLDLVVAATEDSICMVECSANEVPEEVMIEALSLAHEEIKPLVAMQLELQKAAGMPKTPFESEDVSAIEAKVEAAAGAAIDAALDKAVKEERYAAMDEAKDKVVADLVEAEGLEDDADAKKFGRTVKKLFGNLKAARVRQRIAAGKRIDGRGFADIRPISGEVGLLPGTHGSAVFTRGETQALVSVTLGSMSDSQPIKGLVPEKEESFYLHYDFLPFSVGEVRFYRGASRREIGHGMLAQRALDPVIPDKAEFPYTLRIVSQILESNGSSSMASVCGGTLAMMDCGIKIKKPVAGIAMGLVAEGGEYYVLSDILGDEDHYGDMDFKVTGTQHGITALQMDIKVKEMKEGILAKALDQAKEGRLHILREMLKIIDKPKAEFADHVPQILQIQINPSKIGAIIGPGGKVIKGLQAEFDIDIDVSDDGMVHVMGQGREKMNQALAQISMIANGPKVGMTFDGTVKATRDFGAFVEIAPGIEGLVHISDLDEGYVKNVEDYVKVGDKLTVKVINVDRDGKIKLSKKAVDKEKGKTESGEAAPKDDDKAEEAEAKSEE